MTLDRPLVRIGRSRDNDIPLPEDEAPATSARHAKLVRKWGRWYLEDCDSTNGTYLNGERVTRERLCSGDELGFGGPPLFRVEEGTGVSSGPRRLAHILSLILLPVLVLAFFTADHIESRRDPEDFQTAAAVVGRGVFLIATIEEDGSPRPVGTAFALDATGLLATNAHVAEAVEPGRAVALANDSGGATRTIRRRWLHPDYRAGSFRDDVALLELEAGRSLSPLELADDYALEQLGRGAPLASLGFPAEASDPHHPRAMLRVTVLGDFRDSRYLEIGEGVVPGTSGSPIFTRTGTVVGLVVGGDFDSHAGSAKRGTISWGVSVRSLRELMKAVESGLGPAGRPVLDER